MNQEEIFQGLVQELHLDGLSPEEQEDALLAIAESVQKQFLLDCYERLGKDMFEALEASVKMGEDFYATTLKHLIPDYEELFQTSRKKVIDAYKQAHSSTETAVVQ